MPEITALDRFATARPRRAAWCAATGDRVRAERQSADLIELVGPLGALYAEWGANKRRYWCVKPAPGLPPLHRRPGQRLHRLRLAPRQSVRPLAPQGGHACD
jgi:hypothetical protein